MPIDVYFSFIAYACATTFLPGPNNVLLLASAGQFGLRKCVPLLLGIWTGLVTVMLIAGGFCSALGQLIPRIAPYFKYAGAAYILYLAWKTLMRKPFSLLFFSAVFAVSGLVILKRSHGEKSRPCLTEPSRWT